MQVGMRQEVRNNLGKWGTQEDQVTFPAQGDALGSPEEKLCLLRPAEVFLQGGLKDMVTLKP